MTINGINNLGWLDPLSISTKRTTSDGKQNSTVAVKTVADTVSLSTTGESLNKAQRPGIYVGADGRTNVNIDEALTVGDKQLVIAATGGLDLIGPNGTHQINQLAMQIAMDRAVGNLSGPVTASYLNNIAASQRRDISLNQQQADALSSAGDASTAAALKAMGPGVSFSVLDRALTFLAQHAKDDP
jgi:hypothetical protein